MSWLEHVRAFARYNRWMNERLFGLAEALGDEERKRDRGAFFHSIHLTLNHLLLADRTWMGRVSGDLERHTSRDAEGRAIVVRALDQELYADFSQLSRERARTDADILTFVDKLEEPQLASSLSFENMRGVQQSMPLWWALGQLFNHQTHHRGQLTTLFTQLGVDPGPTDLLAMLLGEARR